MHKVKLHRKSNPGEDVEADADVVEEFEQNVEALTQTVQEGNKFMEKKIKKWTKANSQ